MNHIVIKDIVVSELNIDSVFIDPISKFKVEIPARLTDIPFKDSTLTCVISNTNCHEVNAIRRVCKLEMPCKYMTIDHFESNDQSINREEIECRVNCLPISQTIDENIMYTLDVENTDIAVCNYIYTNQFKQYNATNEKLPKTTVFNNMILLTLDPGLYIRMRIKVVKQALFGPASPAYHVLHNPVKFDARDDNGVLAIPLHETNQQTEFKLTIKTNGTYEPKQLLYDSIKYLENMIGEFIAVVNKILTEDSTPIKNSINTNNAADTNHVYSATLLGFTSTAVDVVSYRVNKEYCEQMYMVYNSVNDETKISIITDLSLEKVLQMLNKLK